MIRYMSFRNCTEFLLLSKEFRYTIKNLIRTYISTSSRTTKSISLLQVWMVKHSHAKNGMFLKSFSIKSSRTPCLCIQNLVDIAP